MARLKFSPELQGISVQGEVAQGDPLQEIVKRASDANADLIVLASHGRAGLGAFLEGSLAYRLMHQIAKPLWLVRTG